MLSHNHESIRYWLLTRTGAFYNDGTYEIRPELGRKFWPVLKHWACCWLAWHPHLITVREPGVQWFKRWWIAKLPLLSIQIHHYPHRHHNGEQGSAFSHHCHPRHTWTWLIWGHYDHEVQRGGRKNPDAPAKREHVCALKKWWIPCWHLSPNDMHCITYMEGNTWSVFVMAGLWHGWFFREGGSMGSSRLLKKELPVRVKRYAEEDE